MSLRRVALLAAIVCLLVGGVATPVGAHAYLDDASPENGERLDGSPAEITLQYTEGIQSADVAVLDENGADHSVPATVDEVDPTVVRAPVEGLDDGVYTVRWEVLSVDGHTTSGTFLFTVGDERPSREQLLAANAADERTAAGVETVLKGILLVGLVGLLGVPLTLVGAVYPVAPIGRRTERRARRLLVGSAALFLAGTGLLGVVRFVDAYGSSVEGLGGFLGTPLGVAWTVQTAVGAVLLGTLYDRRLTARQLQGCLALSTLGALAVSATSHSASVEGAVGVLVDLAHLFGAGVWLGGLLTLGVVAPVALSQLESPGPAAASVLRRFSVIALAGVTVAAATGLLLAAWHLPGLRVPSTTYDSALAVKTSLVVAALGIASLVRVGVLRRLTARTSQAGGPLARLSTMLGQDAVAAFVRGVRVEAAVLVAVVLLSGLLTSAPTAAVLAADDGSTVLETDADGYDVELRVVPSEVGPNSFDLSVARNGDPAAAEEVTLRFRERQSGDAIPQVELEEREPGTYSTVASLPSAGYWDVRANVWTGDAYVTAEMELFVSPAGDTGHVHAPDPVEGLQAAGLLVGLLGTAALARELWTFERRFG